jgi:hypothetical protein
VGAAAHTFVAPHAVVHAAPQQRFEPTAYMHMIVDQLIATNSMQNIGMVYFQFYALYSTITPLYVNATGVNLAMTAVNLTVDGFNNGTRGLENKIAALQSKIQGLEAKPQIIEICTEVNINMVSLAVNSFCM